MNARKFYLWLIAFTVIVLILINIHLPLPPDVEPQATVTSKIASCDIKSSSGGKTSSALRFVGFNLKSQNAPYIRWNPDKDEFTTVKQLCADKAVVKIWYRAQRLALRPIVTYWLEKYQVIDDVGK